MKGGLHMEKQTKNTDSCAKRFKAYADALGKTKNK